jgi:hypothetical protein
MNMEESGIGDIVFPTRLVLVVLDIEKLKHYKIGTSTHLSLTMIVEELCLSKWIPKKKM